MSEPKQATEAEKIIEIAREAERNVSPKHLLLQDKHPLMVMPSGQIIDMERYMERPRRQRAHVALYEAASFINYVNAYKIAYHTVIFGQATERRASFMAIIDYHQRDDDARLAGHGEHTVLLGLETTPEWIRWVENNNKLLPQQEFAEFIEDNMSDIIEPAGAEILEMAQLLQGKKSVAFKAGRNLRDGSIQLEYSEEIQLTGGGVNRRDDSMKLPEKFKLGIVPFVGANGVEIEARLRFRIGQGGALHFMYILNRPHNVIREAFCAARDEIEQKTELKVMLGAGGALTANAIYCDEATKPRSEQSISAGQSIAAWQPPSLNARR